jgi:hypothetical protein
VLRGSPSILSAKGRRENHVTFYQGAIIFGTVLTAFIMTKLVTDSILLAVLFTPAMAFGALAANYLFHSYYLGPLADKDSNVVIASAVGVVAAILFMMLATRCAMNMSEQRRKRLSARLAGAVHLKT